MGDVHLGVALNFQAFTGPVGPARGGIAPDVAHVLHHRDEEIAYRSDGTNVNREGIGHDLDESYHRMNGVLRGVGERDPQGLRAFMGTTIESVNQQERFAHQHGQPFDRDAAMGIAVIRESRALANNPRVAPERREEAAAINNAAEDYLPKFLAARLTHTEIAPGERPGDFRPD